MLCYVWFGRSMLMMIIQRADDQDLLCYKPNFANCLNIIVLLQRERYKGLKVNNPLWYNCMFRLMLLEKYLKIRNKKLNMNNIAEILKFHNSFKSPSDLEIVITFFH